MQIQSRIAMKLSALAATLALALTACSAPLTPAPTKPASWQDQAVIYEVNVRQYTEAGTFNAFAENLPRLKELGVDILWFMPIHPISKVNRKGTLGSYYSVANYREVNPDFGTKQDFQEMVNIAHDLGFKVVIDWVANHTGWDNPWIKAHPDWYTKGADGKITQPIGTDWFDVADLNYDNQEMRAEMVASMKYWVSEFGIDGFRCDVAGEVPADFWAAARKEIETVKPVWMLAENSDSYDLLNTFNANYGWGLQGLMKDIARGSADNVIFDSTVQGIYSMYPEGTYPVNFITNHDENSWNGTEFMRYQKTVDLMAALSFTMPGMPLIYSGQEVGSDKQLAFFEKDQIDFTDRGYTDFYKKLITLKDQNPALWNGASGGEWVYLESDYQSFVAFARSLGTNRVIFVMNMMPLPKSAHIKFDEFSGSYTNWRTGEKVELNNEREFNFEDVGYEIFTQGSNQ